MKNLRKILKYKNWKHENILKKNDMSDLIRYDTHYVLDVPYLKEKVEVIINRLGFALECLNCNSFDCIHIHIIWKMPEEANYLQSLGFIHIDNKV